MKKVTKYRWFIVHNGKEITTEKHYAQAWDALKDHGINPNDTKSYTIECVHSSETVDKE